MKKTLVTVSIILCTLFANAQNDILGIWYNGDKTGKVEIFKNGEKYFGKITWLKEPISDKTGKPKVNEYDPDKSRRNIPIIGLEVVKEFIYEGKGIFGGGTVYDPENGKTYKGKITLVDKNNLDLRGYVGIPAFGRTENWTRAK